MSSYHQGQWGNWPYAAAAAAEVNDHFPSYSQYSNYPGYLADSMEVYQAQHQHLIHHQMSRATESKPRLSKDEVEVLEAEFQKNHKPNSTTKKGLAEQMRVDNARINNWFQNRRAREKKERNIREYEARQRLEKERGEGEGMSRSLPERHHELVASSAPFPNMKTSRASPDASNDASSTGSGSQALSPDVLPRLSGLHNSSFASQRSFPFASRPESSRNYDDGSHSDGGFDDAQSPQNLDIASRRNQPPISLSISTNPSRSQSAGLLKTGLDLGRRGDFGNPMRRVASASGPMRVTKPSATPRSPFNLSRSPVLAGPRGSVAPPTPDTPVLANQPTNVKADSLAPIQNTYNSLTEKLSGANMNLQDPTVHTPPTTPGIMDNFFSINAAYDMHVSNGAVAPSYNSYQNGYPLASIAQTVPNYVAGDDSSSNPATPALTSQMNPTTYFNGSNGNGAEYNWSEGSTSGGSSPGSNPNVHFMNMTPSSFVAVER